MTYIAAILAASLAFLLGLALGVRRCPEYVEPGWRELERVDSV